MHHRLRIRGRRGLLHIDLFNVLAASVPGFRHGGRCASAETAYDARLLNLLIRLDDLVDLSRDLRFDGRRLAIQIFGETVEIIDQHLLKDLHVDRTILVLVWDGIEDGLGLTQVKNTLHLHCFFDNDPALLRHKSPFFSENILHLQ